MNKIPNLDAMGHDELWAFYQEYKLATRKQAEALVGDRRKGFTVIAHTLANYACNKAVAISCRLKGDITAAQCYEHAADRSYNRLPEDLKW